MKIFISYRRADSTYLIGRIKEKLMAAFGEQSVFRDLDDIPAGVDFRGVLERETNGCDVMLVIIGPQWANICDAEGNKRLFQPGDYTRMEVESGLRRLQEGGTMVIPILVMEAKMPARFDLPGSLEQLTYQNAIAIRNDPDFNHDMGRLIWDIRHLRGYAVEDIPGTYFEPKTIYIAEGPFLMGSLEKPGIQRCEIPQHPVDLPAYRIGKYPVTNDEFEEFIRQTKALVSPQLGWEGRKVPQGLGRHPVSGVTWLEALAYCQWLGDATGRNYLLPNEAQWEKACRGGRSSCFYPWGEEFNPARCNHGGQNLVPVDMYPAQNEFGCHDLVGNVLQWTCTLWGKNRLQPDPPYQYPWQDDGRNDPGPNPEIRRVVRGSTMLEAIALHRCSRRSGEAPNDRGFPGARFGFRVAMSI